VTRWQFWDASQFSPQLGTLAFQRVLKRMFGMGEPDAAKVDEALVNFRRFAAVLDKHLDGKRYVVGGSLTLADLTLASSLMYAEQTDVPLSEFPNLQALFSRISDMDAWKATNP
jgi:glutathione S-transferase